jgi:signal transduction histidine kinase
MDQKGQYRQNVFYNRNQEVLPVEKIWRTGKMAYRPDITKEDPYEEKAKLRYAQRAIVDVPFAQGTLAVSSTEPEAFSERDLDVLRDMGSIMSEGFGRFQDLQKLEQRNRELTAELGHVQEEQQRRLVLEGQLFRAQKMEAVGEFTAGIAHNFNNMLQGVMFNLQLAMQDPSSDLKTILQESYSAAAKTADMVRQLLVFSRQSSAQKNPVDAPTLLQGIVDICRKIFDRQIAIVIEASDNLPAILGDSQQLEQVILSLLLNSRDALEESSDGTPTIRLTVDVKTIDPAAALPHIDARPGTYIRISVTDNGAGMDAKTCERVFDPFFTTKPVDRGTGLGLSTAYAMVQQHEGWIECASQKGKGSTFTLFLPATAPMTPADTKAQNVKTGIIAGGKETLLIIDDEEVVRRSTQQLLRRMGYTVLDSADGADGLQTFEREEKLDLILLDLSMPHMSGEEVLAALKERDPDVKVLIMTGYGPDKGNIAGAAGIIRKPFTPEELDATIRQVLDS